MIGKIKKRLKSSHRRGLVILVPFMLLTACWESSDITIHSPGKYLGASDPLLQGVDNAALLERFKQIQTDR